MRSEPCRRGDFARRHCHVETADRLHAYLAGSSESPIRATNPNQEIGFIVEHGGFVGVTMFPPFLGRRNNSTVENYAAIDYVIRIAGEDNVGIGTDFTQDQDHALFEYICHDKGYGWRVTGPWPSPARSNGSLHAAGPGWSGQRHDRRSRPASDAEECGDDGTEFAADSPLEEAGFEPSVPRDTTKFSMPAHVTYAWFPAHGKVGANENRHHEDAGRFPRNRWFESGFLHRRVRISRSRTFRTPRP